MTPKQEAALREYLQEAIVPLIEQVLVKKLGQAMSFAAEELIQPKPAQQQEPVGYTSQSWLAQSTGGQFSKRKGICGDVALYTSPPASKPWVGLTNDEIALLNADYPHPQGFARALEAKLREKNT